MNSLDLLALTAIPATHFLVWPDGPGPMLTPRFVGWEAFERASAAGQYHYTN